MKAPHAAWVVIPVKREGEGKTRLAGALTPDQRRALVKAMLRHVVEQARQAHGVTRVFLAGPSRHGLDHDLGLLATDTQGLNAALQDSIREIATERDPPGRIIVLPADLPALTSGDVERLMAASETDILIAPDRSKRGTNALSLPISALPCFTFHFGSDSFRRHREEAEAQRYNVKTILSPGLEKDVDEPHDLTDARNVYAPLA